MFMLANKHIIESVVGDDLDRGHGIRRRKDKVKCHCCLLIWLRLVSVYASQGAVIYHDYRHGDSIFSQTAVLTD